MVAICKSIYVVYRTNSTNKVLHSGLLKYFCTGENGWRVSISAQSQQSAVSVRMNIHSYLVGTYYLGMEGRGRGHNFTDFCL